MRERQNNGAASEALGTRRDVLTSSASSTSPPGLASWRPPEGVAAEHRGLLAGLDAFNSGDVERILDVRRPRFRSLVPGRGVSRARHLQGLRGRAALLRPFAEAMADIRFEADVYGTAARTWWSS